MGNLYKNIATLCEGKGITGAKMCTDIGISKGLITDLKMGRRTGITAVTAQKIASYFGVSVAVLLGEEDIKKKQTTTNGDLSSKREALMRFAQSVPENKIDMILQVMQTILANG